MHTFHLTGALARALVLTLAVLAAGAWAQAPSKHLAPGFVHLDNGEKVLLMPVDVELFSLSAGGVPEPKADWTAAATGFMQQALVDKLKATGLQVQPGDEALGDEFAEQVGLHAAVARSIALHHSMGGGWALPTKAGLLDWSFGDAMQPLARKTGARRAIFVWVRDSYASAERKAAMVLMAMAGIGLTGGIQYGYASLVDLESGRVLWFNQLTRGSGDLRESEPAKESMGALLTGFPAAK
ncbi:MAG: hypothetical protein J0M20_11645 [Burkholderiales bacterium]|nr:hypothetical protein [Burkholderiales bacterium]